MKTRTLSSNGSWSKVAALLALGLAVVSPTHAFPIITDVVETGGDNEPTDTVTAKWTGVTFVNGVANEPINGTAADASYTVGLFVEDCPMFVDRNHQWNGCAVDKPIPDYLLGGEYVMSGNDNRDNANYRLDITVSEPVFAYMLIDDRLADGNNADPPTFGPNSMAWIARDGWLPVATGWNRHNNPSWPDHVGADEGGDGVGPGVALNQWSSIYRTLQPAGTFSIFQPDNGGRNMYGLVVKPMPDDPSLLGFSQTPLELIISVADGRLNAVANNGVALNLDGQNVGVTSSKDGLTTTLVYRPSPQFASASAHNAVVTVTDTSNNTYTFNIAWTTQYYAVIPAGYAVQSPTDPGMTARTHQLVQDNDVRGPGNRENEIPQAEHQFADGYGPNVAANADPGPHQVFTYVNWEVNGGNIGTTPPYPDNFNSEEPTVGVYYNDPVPGLSRWLDGVINNIVVETTAYLEFPAGFYRMGVNSDDGFKVTCAPGAQDPFGIVVGSFNGGRGASDTVFYLQIEEAGVYPFRLLWCQGDGNGNVEWFMENLQTGARTLINDIDYSPAATIKAYRAASERAHISRMRPAAGYRGVDARQTFTVELKDGRTQVVDGSVELWIDGAKVDANVVNGPTTILTWTPPQPFPAGSSHTGTIKWTENTSPETVWQHEFSFQVVLWEAQDMPTGSLWIEAEDFNYNGGETLLLELDDWDTYEGDYYSGLGAVHNVDYYEIGTDTANNNYRLGEDPSVPLYANNKTPTLDRTRFRRDGTLFDRPANNWRIGGISAGQWYNYTRNIPQGIYTAYMVASHDTLNLDIGGYLELVTGPVNVPNQTTTRLGSFRGPAAGGWGYNSFVPLRSQDSITAPPAYFKMPGGLATLRVVTRTGDFDWFALAPASNVPPAVRSASPANGAQVRRDGGALTVTIEDFNSQVAQGGVKLIYDDVDVTASASITKLGDITTVTYNPGLLERNTYHTYEVEFTDNANPALTQSYRGTYWVGLYPTEGIFLIEAEDYNYGSGQYVGQANQMPYHGNAYEGLAGTLNVDYYNTDTDPNNAAVLPYRTLQYPNNNNISDNMAGRNGSDRGVWTMDYNYKIGWIAGNEWFNYTRDLGPGGAYEIWAAMAHDTTNPGALAGRIDRVTSDPSQPDQTLAPLGVFNARGSGGWSQNDLVPAVDETTGDVIAASLSGVVTLRFSAGSGDFDYLVLVPTSAVPPPEFTETTAEGSQIILTWTGGGTLEKAPAVTGPWEPVTGATSGSPITPGGPQEFYRVRQ